VPLRTIGFQPVPVSLIAFPRFPAEITSPFHPCGYYFRSQAFEPVFVRPMQVHGRTAVFPIQNFFFSE